MVSAVQSYPSPISGPEGLSVRAARHGASPQEKPVPAAPAFRALEGAAPPLWYRSIRVEQTWEVSGQFRRSLHLSLTLSQFTLAGLAGELLAPFLFLLTGALLCVPSQAVQDIINQVLEKLEENQVPMRDYALKSSGAVRL